MKHTVGVVTILALVGCFRVETQQNVCVGANCADAGAVDAHGIDAGKPDVATTPPNIDAGTHGRDAGATDGGTDGIDATAPDCAPGTHVCGPGCQPDQSVDSCGTSCLPCPSDRHGTATCTAGTCGISCNPGSRLTATGCTPWLIEPVYNMGTPVKFSLALDPDGNPRVAAFIP